MGLGAIGDMGGGGLNAVSATPKTWDAAADWDAAVDEQGVVHESFGDLPGDGTIQLGYPSYDEFGTSSLLGYYDMGDSAGPLTEQVGGNWTDATESGNPTYDNTGPLGLSAVRYDGTDDYHTVSEPSDLPLGSDPRTAVIWWNTDSITDNDQETFFAWGGEGTEDHNFALRTRDSNSDNTEDALYLFYWANDHSTGNLGYSAGAWNFAVVAYDGSTSYIAHNGGTYDTYSAGAVNTQSNPVRIGRRSESTSQIMDGGLAHFRVYDRALSQSEADALYVLSGSYLTTATKTFASPVSPDLSNLSYNLNSETITLDVIGSPGGGGEETVSQSLDGSTSYALSWSSSHTDFRVKINMSSSTPTASPDFSAVTLSP